ncbi:phage repressor protein/antirepressor Ant [Lactobacillus helveticus]|uniref:Antirepressor n=1 Tax=Lactobacillus helveticus TaxID=1587 RepID=A0AAU8XSW6_LACHE|nr:phage antirepressor [Lactobacillus helveticus]AUI73869.1 antirepressor [Lactobacillus helveticus]PXZ15121.1 phage repressor protein/antirepressor Ant [Lactobacillus helveticus]PXZ16957.1 phage repressor protein/antirepressor Ant [Lactobacillus helveticus]PXZ24219.1 phage repressor protein/antirepressor Ant [Lactobacillus helveticus]PXZ27543.1 phage repressor protein/antirepressor Ant [Lactobacillus helveticus]
MDSNLQLFDFEGNQVRTLEIKNEPWFVGKDVAEILGYKNTRDALAKHVDAEDKISEIVKASQVSQNATGYQNIDLISESGVYALIFGSKMPNAKKFKHWVTSKVLPAIRKHGAYMTDEKAFDVVHNKNGLADLLQQAADQLKQKDIQINQMKPKALFADAVATSKSDILIGQLAKILRQNGYETGQNRLFKWLREHHYLCSKGVRYNQPTQKAMELGLFKVKERTVNNPDGSSRITVTTKVTGKGQQYFINRFLNSEPSQLSLEIESI